ncbi:unnamed protein product [Cuscuta campestris]|uniref:Replication factor A C-terminal domain-containing protein n=1 Tax=Cuscuta campestris TaxID=132261 RepID=A0A484NFE5_9ASTE|nr:unnamed protein product [Cuscuta campestris]
MLQYSHFTLTLLKIFTRNRLRGAFSPPPPPPSLTVGSFRRLRRKKIRRLPGAEFVPWATAGLVRCMEISNYNGLSPKQPVFILEDSLAAACLLSGTTIHATVRKSLVGTFEKRIKEGSVYVFAYFGIGISSGNYRTSRHEFRLNFQPRTTVAACSCERIPVHGLKLTTISEILQADSNYPYLVDTMGVLTAVGKQKEIVKESKRTKMIVIQLEADGVTLDITLFGEYVDKIKSFFGRQPLENVIIVIQYAKVKTYQGNVNLQNVMYGTRLLLNPEIEEVVAFRQRIVGVPTNRRPLELPCDDVTVVQQNEFLDATQMTTISLLKDGSEDGTYIVYATVVSVNNIGDWFYLACKCNRAVRADGTMYYCAYCGCRVMNVTPRYRIKTRVVDTTDSATFVVLESVACLLLHKSCSEMLKYSENLPSGDIKPDVFNRLLIDKSYLFKVDNLIEDCVQSKDNQFERLEDDITDSNIGKRIEEVESEYADGHEPSKKMKTIKIEKI